MDKTNTFQMENFRAWLKDQGKTENTIKTYVSVMTKFLDWLDDQEISIISQESVQSYMNFLDKEQLSGSTIDKVFATIRVYAQFSGSPEIVDHVKRKEKENHVYHTIPESLTDREIESLLQAVKKDGDLRNNAIVYTLLYTGIRISELCALNVEDVRFHDQKGTLHVTNTHGNRHIPLSKEVVYHLKKYMEHIDHINDNALFISSFKKRMTTRAVQYMLKKYEVNPHKLRHTFCQDLITKGMDIAIVAQLAGHDDLNITKRYMKAIISKENISGTNG